VTAIRTPEQQRRERRFGVVSLVFAAVMAAVFAVGGAGTIATFNLGGRGATFLNAVQVPVGLTGGLLALVVAVLGVVQLVRGFGDRAATVVSVSAGLFTLAFLAWAARDDTLPLLGLFQNTLSGSVPLALGAMCGLVCERSGVINIGIEAQFLFAAFAAAVVGSVSGSAAVGMVGGIAVGVLVGGLLAVMSIRFRADQIVVGVVLVVLAAGLTSFLNQQLLQPAPELNQPAGFGRLDVPLLSDIPFLGPLLFRQTVPVYLMLIAVPLLNWALFRTRWGLRLRSVGEHPRAADTVGINVLGTRYRAVMLGGALAGIGGAWFTLDSAGQFSPGMSAGLGFIALAAMLIGRYHPYGAFGAALVFGFAGEIATSLSILDVGVPSTLLLTVPYVVTIIVVAGFVGRLRVPAADGKPYTKE
jgi:simple sugar transport system permease protein